MTVSINVDQNRFCISKISWKADIPVCQFALQVNSDGSGLISVFNQKLISTPLDFPEKLNTHSFDKLLLSISSASVCFGNADHSDLINKKNTLASYEELKNRKAEIIATLDNDQFSQVFDATAIRHVGCSVIIFTGERCDHCSKYRKTLNALSWKLKNIDASVYYKKTVNNFLSREHLEMKDSVLAKEVKRLRRSVENLESFLHGAVENEGEFIPEKLHKICKKNSKNGKNRFST